MTDDKDGVTCNRHQQREPQLTTGPLYEHPLVGINKEQGKRDGDGESRGGGEGGKEGEERIWQVSAFSRFPSDLLLFPGPKDVIIAHLLCKSHY